MCRPQFRLYGPNSHGYAAYGMPNQADGTRSVPAALVPHKERAIRLDSPLGVVVASLHRPTPPAAVARHKPTGRRRPEAPHSTARAWRLCQPCGASLPMPCATPNPLQSRKFGRIRDSILRKIRSPPLDNGGEIADTIFRTCSPSDPPQGFGRGYFFLEGACHGHRTSY